METHGETLRTSQVPKCCGFGSSISCTHKSFTRNSIIALDVRRLRSRHIAWAGQNWCNVDWFAEGDADFMGGLDNVVALNDPADDHMEIAGR